MDTNVEKLLVLVFFVLPGYVGLYVYDSVVAPRLRSVLDATLWSVVLSLAGASLAALWVPAEYLAHLFAPTGLSVKALLGTGAQMASAIAVSGVIGLVVKRVFKGRLGERSAYPTAWDALWSGHAGEQRFVGVDTPNGYYFGALAAADDPRIGRAVVMQAPSLWNEKARRYLRTGAEFAYFPTDQIRRIDLSEVPQPAGSEERDGRQGSIEAAGRASGDGDQGHGGKAVAEVAGPGRVPRAQGRAEDSGNEPDHQPDATAHGPEPGR